MWSRLLPLCLLFGVLAVEARTRKVHGEGVSLASAVRAAEKLGTHPRRARSAEEESGSMESREAQDLMKFFMVAAWQESKREVLAAYLEKMTDSETNMTLVGWQRILDEEGNVRAMRSIQMVIPPKTADKSEKVVQEDDDNDFLDKHGNKRVIPYHEMNAMKDMFEPMRMLGIPSSVTMEEFEESGELKVLMYMDKDEMYMNLGEMAIINKTMAASSQEITEFIANMKPTALGKPTVLKYDVDGKLLSDMSSIRPHLLGSVIDEYNAPPDVLTASPLIMSEISLRHPRESIPKELALEFNKKFPQFRWRVLVDPSEYHIMRNVSVTLAYDNFDLDEMSYNNYLVYGLHQEMS